MKKRNLVAMGLAGVMAVGMCMPVMAAVGPTSGTDGTPNSNSTNTSVTADVDIAYELTIPATVEFKTDGSSKISLSVDENTFLVHEDKMVKVAIQDADKLQLKNKKSDGSMDGSKTYDIQLEKTEGTGLTSNDAAATFTNDDKTTVDLSVVGKTGQTFGAAGHYTGDVTFLITYE